MSSIDNKPTGLPSYNPQPLGTGAAAADPNAPDPTSATGATRDVSGSNAPQAAHGPNAKQQVQLSGTGTLLATPPPLPPTRGVINADTAANYQSLTQDIGGALAKGMPKSHANLTTSLAQTMTADTTTPAGKAKLQSQVTSAVNSSLKHLNASNDAGMMAAFLELNVKNAASGKELQANLLNLATQARNTLIQQSILERQAQAKALQKAHDKQKALGPLFTILKVVILAVSAIAAVATFGAGATIAAMLIGAVVGGAVKGAKNGKGFDLMGALDGAGYALDALGLAALLKTVAKMALSSLEKLGAKVALQRTSSGGGDSTVRKAMNYVADKASSTGSSVTSAAKDLEKKLLDKKMARDLIDQASAVKATIANSSAGKAVGVASSKAANSFAAATGTSGKLLTSGKAMDLVWVQGAVTALQVTQQVAQSIADYAHTKTLLEAKQHEANAKGINVMVDDAQARWESLQGSLQGISDAHNRAADQSLEMVNRHAATAQKAARLISG